MAGPIHRTDHYDLFFSPNSLPLPSPGPDCLRSAGWQLRLASPPIPPAERNSHQLLTSPPHICSCQQELIRHYKTLLICFRKLLVKINLCSLFLSLCVFVCPSLFSTCAHMCAYACACARTRPNQLNLPGIFLVLSVLPGCNYYCLLNIYPGK